MNTFCQIMAEIAATAAEVLHSGHHSIQYQFSTVEVRRLAFSRFPRPASLSKTFDAETVCPRRNGECFLERSKFSVFVGVSSENLW